LPACRCPFAQRAWITLIEKKLKFEQKIVDLQNKPKHFKELYASIHPDPTAPAKVPIIIGESASASVTTAIRHPHPI
jgi:glutathione S-transferase